MKVTKEMRTETGHRLTAYSGRCAHLHGHSYRWQVTARSSELDEKNMVMDFKDLKKAMNTVLDPLDHCMVLAPDDPLMQIAESLSTVKWQAERWKTEPDEYSCSPENILSELFLSTSGQQPRLILWHDNPTAESFAAWALEKIEAELLRLWEKGMVDSHAEQETFDLAHHSMPYFISSVRVWETATSYAEASSGEG